MDRTLELPIGTMPAPILASSALLEVVVHGWVYGLHNGLLEDLCMTVAKIEDV